MRLFQGAARQPVKPEPDFSDDVLHRIARDMCRFLDLPDEAQARVFMATAAARDAGGGPKELADAATIAIRPFQYPAPTRVLVPEEAVSADHW